jgi:hypothetical protein
VLFALNQVGRGLVPLLPHAGQGAITTAFILCTGNSSPGGLEARLPFHEFETDAEGKKCAVPRIRTSDKKKRGGGGGCGYATTKAIPSLFLTARGCVSDSRPRRRRAAAWHDAKNSAMGWNGSPARAINMGALCHSSGVKAAWVRLDRILMTLFCHLVKLAWTRVRLTRRGGIRGSPSLKMFFFEAALHLRRGGETIRSDWKAFGGVLGARRICIQKGDGTPRHARVPAILIRQARRTMAGLAPRIVNEWSPATNPPPRTGLPGEARRDTTPFAWRQAF